MKTLLLLLALVPALAQGAPTFYGPGNTGDGFNDLSGAGHNPTLFGTVLQPDTPTPPEGDQWFANPAGTDQNYLVMPNAVWNGANGMTEFYYLETGDPVGTFDNIVMIITNGTTWFNGSSNTYLWHFLPGQLGIGFKHNGTFHTFVNILLKPGKNLLREEHDAAAGTQDLYLNGALVWHTTDYVSYNATIVWMMGGVFGLNSDFHGKIDAVQFGSSHADAYLGPPLPTPTPTPFPFGKFRFDCKRDFK